MHEPTSGNGQAPPEGVDADIRLRPVLGCGLGLFLLVIIAMWGMWVLLSYFTRRNERQTPSVFPLAATERGRPLEERFPPAPRLEGLDLREPIRSGVPGWPAQGPMLEKEQKELLASYGWTDEEKGIVRIPISVAISRLAGKLPGRPGHSYRPDRGASTRLPTRASSGRQTPGGDR